MADAFSVSLEPEVRRNSWTSVDLLFADGVRRTNEDNDELFYAAPRKRPFFDERTDEAIRRHHERILPQGATRVLDLMSSLESHLSKGPEREVVGLGMNEEEMRRNRALSSVVVHDLNRDPRLPFEEGSFDAVICSGSIDLLTHPLEVVRDVARVLRKGGVFVVTFTDRTIMPKSIEAWRDEGNEGRLMLATAYFSFSGAFLRPLVEVDEIDAPECVIGGPGATHGDEVLNVVWSYKPPANQVIDAREAKLERRAVPSERHCPFCGELMLMWQPPETPWEIDYNATLLYVCFNDECDYFARGRRWCRRKGMRCATYRHSLNPTNGSEGPLPVPIKGALRAGIVEET
jgi:SAM-dependent methyltransferase